MPLFFTDDENVIIIKTTSSDSILYVNLIISMNRNEFSFSKESLTCCSTTAFCTPPSQTVLVITEVREEALLPNISKHSVLQCFPHCSWLSHLAIGESVFFPEFPFANSMTVKSLIAVLNVPHPSQLQASAGLPGFIPTYSVNAFSVLFCCCCLYLFLPLVCFLFVF